LERKSRPRLAAGVLGRNGEGEDEKDDAQDQANAKIEVVRRLAEREPDGRGQEESHAETLEDAFFHPFYCIPRERAGWSCLRLERSSSYLGNLRADALSRYFSRDMARYKGQRRSDRHWVAVPVLIRHRGARIEGLSINISDGGIYLFAAANLSLAERIEVEFCPPDSESAVRTWGTVRRRALYLYAIEFVSEDAASARDRAREAQAKQGF